MKKVFIKVLNIFRIVLSIICIITMCYNWYKCSTLPPLFSQKPSNMLKMPSNPLFDNYWSLMAISAFILVVINLRKLINHLKKTITNLRKKHKKSLQKKNSKGGPKKSKNKIIGKNKRVPVQNQIGLGLFLLSPTMRSATPSPTGTVSPSPGRTAGGWLQFLMAMTVSAILITLMESVPVKR